MDEEERARPTALVLDLLGDFNRTGGRELRLKTLVELGERLGVPGPTMRVSLARLKERGWFEVQRDGRESIYRFTPSALVSLHEGGDRLHRPASERWSGDWSMVIYTVPESDRQTRDELRKQLAWLGFGPLAPATWIRPHPQVDDVAARIGGLSSARLTVMTTRTSGLAEDRALAARCWDLDALDADYASFVRDLQARSGRLRVAALDDDDAFVARVGLVNRYRRFGARDPWLPLDLQPAGWHGEEARRLFESAHAQLSAGSDGFYRRLSVSGV